MANFLLLYTGGEMPAEADRAAIMKEWEGWFGALGANLVDGGQPFMPMAKAVSSGGMVSDGAVGKPAATGYSIIKADSLDAAVAVAKDCPVLKGGSQITVYEAAAGMGM
jgi:hypothetical protein